MKNKRDLIFNIFIIIDNKNIKIANINYNYKIDSSNIEIYDKELVKNLIPIENNGRDLNWEEIIKFLESRLFPRDDDRTLKNFGLEEFDLFKLLEITKGKRINDCFNVELVKY